MDIRPIRTEEDYQAALREVSAYFDNEPAPGTADGDRFEILLTLVEAYEAKHYPIDLPDPVEAIKFRMDQAGLTPKDLTPVIGRLNRVYVQCACATRHLYIVAWNGGWRQGGRCPP
jgi:HTH-type transcriptional regulator/antitoxin HigA